MDVGNPLDKLNKVINTVTKIYRADLIFYIYYLSDIYYRLYSK